jgi:hypothetical protein
MTYCYRCIHCGLLPGGLQLRAAILMVVYWLPHAGCVACSTVELVAARSIPQSGELSISYGDRPLRDFLRGYAFNPSDSSFEVRHYSRYPAQNAHLNA